MIELLNHQNQTGLSAPADESDGKNQAMAKKKSTWQPNLGTSVDSIGNTAIDIEAVFHNRLLRQLKPEKNND